MWKEREQPRACGAGSRAPQIVARSLGCVLRCRGQPWWCPQSVATPSPWPWCRGLNVIYVLPFGKPLLGVWDKTHLQLGHCRTVPCHPSGGLGLPHPPGSLWGVGQQQGFSGHLYKRPDFPQKWMGKTCESPFLGEVSFSPAARPPGQWLSGTAVELDRNRTQLPREMVCGRALQPQLSHANQPWFPNKNARTHLTKPSVYLRHL